TTDTGSASPPTAPGCSSWPATNPFSRQDCVPWHAILSRKRSDSACEEATERGEDSIQVGDADRLVGLMGLGGLSRPEVDGGDADLREASHVGPALLGGASGSAQLRQPGQDRMIHRYRSGRGGIGHLELVGGGADLAEL